MKNILVVGFGAIGCRHVQSLVAFPDKYNVHVLEPSPEVVQANIQRIGVSAHVITWHTDLQEINADFDVAIVATSSGPRFEIVKNLLQRRVKTFLLEKIVFQSSDQFENVINLLDKHSGKAYCNFVSRYYNSYNQIKQELKNRSSSFQMFVYGGEFGLGCNAIHYIDVFQYIADGGYNIEMVESDLKMSESENRRGKQYKEFTGFIRLQNKKNDTITIISDKGFLGGVTISVHSDQKRYFLSEQTGKMFSGDNSTVESDFNIIPTSRLTSTIVQEMLAGDCRLTQVKDTAAAHKVLFNAFNKLVYGNTSPELICPIT